VVLRYSIVVKIVQYFGQGNTSLKKRMDLKSMSFLLLDYFWKNYKGVANKIPYKKKLLHGKP